MSWSFCNVAAQTWPANMCLCCASAMLFIVKLHHSTEAVSFFGDELMGRHQCSAQMHHGPAYMLEQHERSVPQYSWSTSRALHRQRARRANACVLYGMRDIELGPAAL